MVAMPCLRSDRIVSARFPRKTAKRRATIAEPTTTIRQKKKNGTEFCAVVKKVFVGETFASEASSSSSSSAPRNNNAVLDASTTVAQKRVASVDATSSKAITIHLVASPF